MLENFQGDSWGSIPPLRMPSLLPHDLCHGRSAWLPAVIEFQLSYSRSSLNMQYAGSQHWSIWVSWIYLLAFKPFSKFPFELAWAITEIGVLLDIHPLESSFKKMGMWGDFRNIWCFIDAKNICWDSGVLRWAHSLSLQLEFLVLPTVHDTDRHSTAKLWFP